MLKATRQDHGCAPEGSPLLAMRSRYLSFLPTSLSATAVICAAASMFRMLCFPANSCTWRSNALTTACGMLQIDSPPLVSEHECGIAGCRSHEVRVGKERRFLVVQPKVYRAPVLEAIKRSVPGASQIKCSLACKDQRTVSVVVAWCRRNPTRIGDAAPVVVRRVEAHRAKPIQRDCLPVRGSPRSSMLGWSVLIDGLQ